MEKFSEITKLNPEAHSYLKKAKVNRVVGYFIAFTGGCAIGYALGTAITGKGINWGVMGAGIGAVGLSIPFAIGIKRNLIKAVHSYNTTSL
jgi:hypothetical protein